MLSYIQKAYFYHFKKNVKSLVKDLVALSSGMFHRSIGSLVKNWELIYFNLRIQIPLKCIFYVLVGVRIIKVVNEERK